MPFVGFAGLRPVMVMTAGVVCRTAIALACAGETVCLGPERGGQIAYAAGVVVGVLIVAANFIVLILLTG
jgi:hypothetical protein